MARYYGVLITYVYVNVQILRIAFSIISYSNN